MGFIDCAGGGIVHLLGGTIGLMGTIILKPRLGVFNNYDVSGGLGGALKVSRDHNILISQVEAELAKLYEEFEIGTGKKAETINQAV
jgi:ammonia channel protein AmtB